MGNRLIRQLRRFFAAQRGPLCWLHAVKREIWWRQLGMAATAGTTAGERQLATTTGDIHPSPTAGDINPSQICLTSLHHKRWQQIETAGMTLRANSVAPLHPRARRRISIHCVSRCVRRSWLCGFDGYLEKSFEHRKLWLSSASWNWARFLRVVFTLAPS